ncbi:MAG: glycoside hydrolase family 13 protein [Bacteroidota bacterium]
MLKEFIFTSYQTGVESVHVGIFPAMGRYFVEEMQSRSDGIFHAAVELPLGKSYCHYFVNGDFQNPVKYASGQQRGTFHDRIPVLLESDLFCPLEFAAEGPYLSYLGDGEWELKAVSHQNWIRQVALISERGTFPLQRAYQHKSKCFWSWRFHQATVGQHFILKIKGDFQVRYLHRGYRIRPICDFKKAYVLPARPPDQPAAALAPGMVGYQVYPDSFCRLADCSETDGFHAWGSPPQLQGYYGGNLKGIEARLDYLRQLGVEFVYCNPIFSARSPHRYDCIDYRRIDPLLGDEEDLRALIDGLHAREMQFVLDVAVNHCSVDFPPFRDLLEHQEASAYRDWFVVQSYPVALDRPGSYLSWGNFQDMPLLNAQHPELRAYLLDGLRYWTETFAIDGWRLDVSTEIDEDFVRAIADTIRSVRPNATLVGECWYHRNGRCVIEKGRLDGLTNFSLYWECFIPFFASEQLTLRSLAHGLVKNYWSTDWRTTAHSWIFLSNHDTPRFYSQLRVKEWYPLAFALLYALPGQPLLYYGEEIGMEGGADPANRGSMDWEKAMAAGSMQAFVRDLNALRTKYRNVLGRGSLSIPLADDERQLLAIRRDWRGQQVLFLFNFARRAVLLGPREGQILAPQLERVFPSALHSPADRGYLAPHSVHVFAQPKPISHEK